MAALATGAIVLNSSPEKGESRVAGGVINFDANDPAELAARCENLFIGRVIGKRSEIQRRPRFPEVQFDIEVLETIKGELTGRTVVNAIFVEEAAGTVKSLDQGATYFFATRQAPTPGWHSAAIPQARVRLDSAEQRAQIVARYRAVVATG